MHVINWEGHLDDEISELEDSEDERNGDSNDEQVENVKVSHKRKGLCMVHFL